MRHVRLLGLHAHTWARYQGRPLCAAPGTTPQTLGQQCSRQKLSNSTHGNATSQFLRTSAFAVGSLPPASSTPALHARDQPAAAPLAPDAPDVQLPKKFKHQWHQDNQAVQLLSNARQMIQHTCTNRTLGWRTTNRLCTAYVYAKRQQAKLHEARASRWSRSHPRVHPNSQNPQAVPHSGLRHWRQAGAAHADRAVT